MWRSYRETVAPPGGLDEARGAHLVADVEETSAQVGDVRDDDLLVRDRVRHVSAAQHHWYSPQLRHLASPWQTTREVRKIHSKTSCVFATTAVNDLRKKNDMLSNYFIAPIN